MLARDLGKTVSELRERMTNYEFMQWKALYRVEGIEKEKEAKALKAKRRR